MDLKGRPELRHFFKQQRLKGNANALNLVCQIAGGQITVGAHGISDFVCPQEWMVMKNLHGLTEECMTSGLIPFIAAVGRQ